MTVSFAPYLSAHDVSVCIDFLLFALTLAGVAIFTGIRSPSLSAA